MNRSTQRRNPVLAIAAFAIATWAAAGLNAAEKITVMNPSMPNRLAKRIPLTAHRLASVEGKTIYLVDIQWGGPEGGYSLLEEVQAWFAENMPSVKTVLRRTKDNMFSDDPALWKEIAAKGNAAIVGIAQ